MKKLTDPKESATRKRIDAILNNLNWKTNESKPDCNVFTERAKTREQHKSLGGFEPDYVLYESGTDNPIAIVEAKRSGQSPAKALDQAIEQYAEPLKVNIVFVADGAIIETHDRRDGKNLRLDGDLITSLLTEKQLLRYAKEGSNIYTPDSVRHTKQELIKVFGEANDLLRKEGLRKGIERFTEFSNLLFLKLISEIEDDRELSGDASVNNSNVKLIPKGTVLLSFKLSIGKVAIAGRDLYTNEAIAALIPKDERLLPKYLYYILPRLNLAGQSGARKAAKGKTSSKGRLEKVLIPLPPHITQQKIIAEMERRDAEIVEHRNEIIRIASDGQKFIEKYAAL